MQHSSRRTPPLAQHRHADSAIAKGWLSRSLDRSSGYTTGVDRIKMEILLKCQTCGKSFKVVEGDVEVCPHCLRLTPSEIKSLRKQRHLASAQMRGKFVDLF